MSAASLKSYHKLHQQLLLDEFFSIFFDSRPKSLLAACSDGNLNSPTHVKGHGIKMKDRESSLGPEKPNMSNV